MKVNNKGTGSTRAVGFQKEALAVSFLEQNGYHIIAQNFYMRGGEIDIIANEGGYLVFVEVKYRSRAEYGEPEEAVDYKKIARIIKTARYYLLCNNLPEDTPCRFDVVRILGQDVSVIRNAFET